MPAANDHLASAVALSGASGSVTMDFTGASYTETGSPDEATWWGGPHKSLWFRWTAPATGAVQFTLSAGAPAAWDIAITPDATDWDGWTAYDSAGQSTWAWQTHPVAEVTVAAGDVLLMFVDDYSYETGSAPATAAVLSWAPPPPPAPTGSIWATSGTYDQYTAFPGDDVTVTGTGLDTVTSVTVGGVSQPFTATSSTSLVIHINGSAVSGPVVVSNVSGSATVTRSSHDLTVLYPGPWVQPPDEPAASDAIGLASYAPPGPPYPTGATQPNFAGSPPQSFSASANFLAFEVQAISPQPSPDWRWDAFLPLMVLYPPSSYDMPAYDASGDVTGTPHAVDYQTETGVGSVPTSDLTLTYEIDAQGANYNEDTDNRTLSEDLWQEHIQFRRIPDTDWDSSGFVAGAWPSQAYLAGLPVDHDGPFVNSGATLSLSSSGSWTDNNATLVNGSPAYVDPQDVTLADLAAGRAWAITLTTFTGASSIAAPYIDPSDTFGVGAAQSKAVEPVYGRIHSAWTYRPPRYRLIYDTPPTTAVRTLRRRQQAAPVGSAPRRRQIANRAGSLRRGPGAAP